MPDLGLEILDRAVQDTNTWLGEIAEAMGHPDRQVAYHALRGVLSALRDRLVVEEAVHLGAQLPLLVRGVYYEGYVPAGKPTDDGWEEVARRVAEELRTVGGADPEAAVRAVFAVLDRNVDEGQGRHVREMLPDDLRALWPEPGA